MRISLTPVLAPGPSRRPTERRTATSSSSSPCATRRSPSASRSLPFTATRTTSASTSRCWTRPAVACRTSRASRRSETTRRTTTTTCSGSRSTSTPRAGACSPSSPRSSPPTRAPSSLACRSVMRQPGGPLGGRRFHRAVDARVRCCNQPRASRPRARRHTLETRALTGLRDRPRQALRPRKG